MKSDLPFPLACLSLKKMLFSCALKCSFHPQMEKDPCFGMGQKASFSLSAPNKACAGNLWTAGKLTELWEPLGQGLLCPAALACCDANQIHRPVTPL